MTCRALLVIALVASVAGCSGGSASPPPFNSGPALPTPTPTPGPTATPSVAGTLTTSTTQSASTGPLGPIGAGQTATAAIPPASGVSTFAVIFSTAQPAGTPALAALKRRPLTIGGANLTAFAYFTFTPNAAVTALLPSFTFTFPAGATLPNPANSYVAMFDPGQSPPSSWNTISGPATQNGNTFSWTNSNFPFGFVAGRTYSFALFTTTTANIPVATPSPSPTPTPSPVPLHLYVGNDNTPGSVLQFNLPLTASSTPNFAIASNNVFALAVDPSGNLAVGDSASTIQIFNPPLSGASTPAAGFTNGASPHNGQLAFLSTGDLWAATFSNQANRFNAPLSNATTVAASVTDPGMVVVPGAAIDAAQNLYLSNAKLGTAATCPSGAGNCSNLYVYAPPYNGPPVITAAYPGPQVPGTTAIYRTIAVSGTQLFAQTIPAMPADVTGRIDVYNLPITSASGPAFFLRTGVNSPHSVAVDPAGNLYIGNFGDQTITVYSPPITKNSVPSLILKINGTAFAIDAIAVGK